MNGSRQMEVHYIDTGFPYTATESFMDFFEGLTHAPVNFAPLGPMHDQNNAYWSMNMSAYKYGFSSLESTYFTPYESNDQLSTRTWDYFSAVNPEVPAGTDARSRGEAVAGVPAIPEECINHQSDTSLQVAWQDSIDPENMTYEELLDLGEAVGTHNRGLSQELIDLLPTSKCKLRSFFYRKKSRERCVICQARYKLGETRMKLPCKHVYHSECISKWLGINKICPVCNHQVFGEESGK